jgi:hypothetical protein
MFMTSDLCPTQANKRYWPLVAAACLLTLLATAYGTKAVAASRSISQWVSCTGVVDDTSGAMAAFAAAKNGAFTLIVDCPVRLHSGVAVDRGIFIDNETTVQFIGDGKFFVDNMFHPAFIIANSFDINLVDWNVEWDGSVPVNPNFGGYEMNGRFVSSSGTTQPAEAFNDIILTNWLSAHRFVNFNESQGWIKSIWVGGVNPAAVFFITGQTSVVNFSGLKLTVPANAGGNQFMPMAFSFSANWKSGQTVTAKTPETAQYAAVPRWLTFSNITLDGIYMGWQGNVQETTFENIYSGRYGDLQDAGGGTVGGIGKWFPPPHLFYLNTQAADPLLLNTNITMLSIIDEGPRIGVARDKGGSDGSSGYANSLKLSCTSCSVESYVSNRPDGFMDVLPSSGLTVTNVFASFNSAFLNNLYPGAIRFPASGYNNIQFDNMNMSDTASRTTQGPISNSTNSSNNGIVFSNFQISLNWWEGSNLPLPTITGQNNDIALNFDMLGQLMKVSYLETSSLGVTVKTTPTTINHGASTLLNWSATHANSCSATGAWSGSVGTSGSRAVQLGAAGNYNFGLSCESGSAALGTTVRVLAQ